jgi:hypothetical protein
MSFADQDGFRTKRVKMIANRHLTGFQWHKIQLAPLT